MVLLTNVEYQTNWILGYYVNVKPTEHNITANCLNKELLCFFQSILTAPKMFC